MIGSKLGPYELLEEVGRGGMAAVFRAYQPNVDRFVAVKVIYRSIAADSKALERFQREARLVAKLEHPHILPVYDYNGLNDPPYIVMRYLPTGTLKDVLERERLPVHEVAYLLSQIASALDYAHRQGIVHRDIKPSNIMVDGEGNAFLTDFGIARIVEASAGDNLTATGMAIGTPGYMAPEQGLGMPIDGRADIYALGVMVYEMLSGKLPYSAETPMAVIMKHINDPLPFITQVNPALPPAVDGIIQRAIAKKPEDRYTTAGEMARALTTALGPSDEQTPVHLQAAAARTIEELAAVRAAKLRVDTKTITPGALAAGTSIGTGTPPAAPVQRTPAPITIMPPVQPTGSAAPEVPVARTGTQTVMSSGAARGAAVGAGAVILLIALVALGALIATTLINNNLRATTDAQTQIALLITSTAGVNATNNANTANTNATATASAVTAAAAINASASANVTATSTATSALTNVAQLTASGLANLALTNTAVQNALLTAEATASGVQATTVQPTIQPTTAVPTTVQSTVQSTVQPTVQPTLQPTVNVPTATSGITAIALAISPASTLSSPTATMTPTLSPTQTPSVTVTPVPPTLTQTPRPTETIRPSATSTAVPTTLTATPVPTRTRRPTFTSVPPSATPTATLTTIPPTSTATFTPVPPTQTPSVTVTPVPPTPSVVSSPIASEIAVAPTLPPIIAPPAAPEGALPYVNDMETTDAVKDWDFDPSAWRLLPDSGNTSLVGSGGLTKPAVVLGRASPAPEWASANNRNLLLSLSIQLDNQSSVGRVLFRYSESGYYVLEIGSGSVKVSRGASNKVDRPSERQLPGFTQITAPVHSGTFYQWKIWADANRIYVYLDNRLLMQIKDSGTPLPGGAILLQTLSASVNYSVRYDNIKVQRPDAASQHFAGAEWPSTWTRSNVTDAVIGDDGLGTHYIEQSAGIVSPNTGALTNFSISCRLSSVQGGFDLHLRESATGYYLMHFAEGNMTFSSVDNTGKATPIQSFPNFYAHGIFQDFTFEFVDDRVTIYTGKDTLWSQVIANGPQRGDMRFLITRKDDIVRINDVLIAETAKSASEIAQWAFDKIAAVEARPDHELYTEYYDHFVDKFAKKDWWEGGANAPGVPKNDPKSRDYTNYLEMTYAEGASYRIFRYAPGAFLLFGAGTDKQTFRDATNVYLRTDVRVPKTGTAWIAVRTSKTVGSGSLDGYQLALTRSPDNSYTITASGISATGQKTIYYTGALPTSADNPNPEWVPLLIVTYGNKVAFFANNRFVNSRDNIDILGGTVALGVENNTVADFHFFQLRQVMSDNP